MPESSMLKQRIITALVLLAIFVARFVLSVACAICGGGAGADGGGALGMGTSQWL